jgi:hypothetical protein
MKFVLNIFYSIVIGYLFPSLRIHVRIVAVTIYIFCVTKTYILLQFFKQTVNIEMVEGNHKTILNNRKTGNIINSFVL